MKINVKKLGLFLIPFMFAGACVSPVIFGETPVLVSEAAVSEIHNVEDLQKVHLNLNGNYKIADDFVVSENVMWHWTPIGTKEEPFTGTFDGNGFVAPFISIFQAQAYQGFFGYTSGATIKNLKIRGIDFNFDGLGISEYYAGSIAGYACDGTKILNCEVDVRNEIIEKNAIELKYKATIGGIAGVLTGGTSKIKDAIVYEQIKIEENLVNEYDIKVGGIVGSLTDSAVLQNVVNFGGVDVEKAEGATFEKNNYLSVIAGEVSGDKTEIRNAIAGGSVTTKDLTAEKRVVGSLVGRFLGVMPESGNISNSVFVDGINYGDSQTYTERDSTTSDYVTIIPARHLKINDFYFSEEYTYTDTLSITRVFKFYSFVPFESTVWVLNEDEEANISLRLQEFQYFTINLSDAINDLLKISDKPDNIRFKYGSKDANYKIEFKEKDDYKYYKITNVLKNGEVCDWEDLTTQTDTTLQTKDIALYFGYNAEKDVHFYTLKIISNSATQGEYSFEVTPVQYEGSVYVDSEIKGSRVGFAVSSGQTLNFAKSNSPTSAEARAGTLYAFDCWKLYYKTTSEQALDEHGELKKGYYQFNSKYYKLPSDTEGDDNIIYVKDSTTLLDKKAPAFLRVEFGRTVPSFIKVNGKEVYNYLNQDFLLEAVFEYSPYKLAFVKTNTLTLEKVEKILVDGEDITTTQNIAIVGKADLVNVEIYVKAGYELSETNIKNSLQNSAGEPVVNFSEDKTETGKVYKVSFYTGKLDNKKMDQNEKNRFEIALLVNISTEGKASSNLGWIIGGSVGGGVLLIAGIAVLAWYVNAKKKFGGGGGSSSNGGKSTKQPKKKDDDYKKYYI